MPTPVAISTIDSHPEALGQCCRDLDSHFLNLRDEPHVLPPDEFVAVGVGEALLQQSHPAMKEKMSALEQEKADLTAFLADRPDPPALRLHPRMSDLYREKITDLAAALPAREVQTGIGAVAVKVPRVRDRAP